MLLTKKLSFDKVKAALTTAACFAIIFLDKITVFTAYKEKKMNGKILVEELLAYAKSHLSPDGLDIPYLKNRLLCALSEEAPMANAPDTSWAEGLTLPDPLIEKLKAHALEGGLCEEGEEEIFATEIMGLLTPPPSAINRIYHTLLAEKGFAEAIAWFYNLCIYNDYIKKTAIGRNIEWEYLDGETALEVTINLSKPEKNNKDIAKLLTKKKSDEKYPACLLCGENEGYRGTLSHPARANLRTLSLSMGGEDWFVQYSPYAYYREHCIAISRAHTPMKVDAKTAEKLLDFVDAFPTYFIGSNAALPIVGGSILNHEHFQGGGTRLPMQKAPIEHMYDCPIKGVTVGRVRWYNSALRIEGADRATLSALAARIVEAWRVYENPSLGLLSHTGEVPHNTLAPIARREGDCYVIDFILRNNRTDEVYPDGIFHAHPEYHNIKREGIGLIEAMGRFILPGRLKRELSEIEAYLTRQTPYEEQALSSEAHPLFLHREMIASLLAEYPTPLSAEEAKAAVIGRVNKVCAAILGNTAVFPRTEEGLRAFDAFIEGVLAE